MNINTYSVPRLDAWKYLGCTKKYGEKLIADAGLDTAEHILLSELVGMRVIRVFEYRFRKPEAKEVRAKAVQLVRAYAELNKELHPNDVLHYSIISKDIDELAVGRENDMGLGDNCSLIKFGLNFVLEKIDNVSNT